MNQNNSHMSLSQSLIEFIQASVTPFHAVTNAKTLLSAAGFIELNEHENWQVAAQQKYFITRNDSSIIAIKTGNNLDDGLNIIGAHTDSPCLKIKPQPDIVSKGYLQLGVEVYGGVLLNPWFDRDLSIAGRISGVTTQGQRFDELIDFKKAIACIPSLAIHLDRNANKERSINQQNELPLLIACDTQTTPSFHELLKQHAARDDIEAVLDFELCCYDTQAPAVIGLHDEFIASARLDNLLSTYLGLQALIDSNDEHASVFVSTDHEEVGSVSACGAQGPFLRSVLERFVNAEQSLSQLVDGSTLLSVDNAHAVHPNYRSKHDSQHSPLMNNGPVIKINANQRYASNSVTAADFRHLCQKADVPVQTFVTRSDMGCGSTIGPITAGELGIKTLDIGVPQLAMHSIRELAAIQDCAAMLTALRAFLNRQ